MSNVTPERCRRPMSTGTQDRCTGGARVRPPPGVHRGSRASCRSRIPRLFALDPILRLPRSPLTRLSLTLTRRRDDARVHVRRRANARPAQQVTCLASEIPLRRRPWILPPPGDGTWGGEVRYVAGSPLSRSNASGSHRHDQSGTASATRGQPREPVPRQR